MYSIILGLVVGILIAFVAWVRSRRHDLIDLSFGAFIAGMIGIAVGAALGGIIGSHLPATARTDTYRLAAMRQYDGVNGVFVWGSGSVSTGQSYAVMIAGDNGSFKPWSTPQKADIAIRELPELHNEGRMIVRYTKVDDNSILASWGLYTSSYGYSYEFDVPVGSVVHQFKAN